jgi:WW domain-containing oxidoreductase
MAMETFGSRTTADEVLAGLDLSAKTFLITGCASGIGFETMRALAARGGHVFGTARSLERATGACAKVSGKTTPVVCDQNDFASVGAAVKTLRDMDVTLDAIIANAGIMIALRPDVRYGVESQFRINHLSHMLLVNGIADRLREGAGRLVVVSSSAAQEFAPKQGVMFDNLDGHRNYRPWTFYGQSKLANLAFAKSMAITLAARGVTSNALHPGRIPTTLLSRALPRVIRPLAISIAGAIAGSKSVPEGAATPCYLAAHPDLTGKTGGYYADCQPAPSNPLADDAEFRERLWTTSEAILADHARRS